MAEGEVIRKTFQVSYVGEDPDDHAMDVEELGPALLAFGKLLKAANRELNADRANVKVLVASDFEHKCFNIHFEVIQTVWEQLRELLAHKDIKNISELLKWIGITTTGAGTIVGSLIAYLKWKKDRKVETVQEIKDAPDALAVKFQGDNNTITVNKNVFQLSNSKEVLQALDWSLSPVRNGRGKAIEFREDGKPPTVLKKDEVEAIAEAIEGPPPEDVEEEVVEEGKKTVTANLYVYGPVYDSKAPLWRFWYRDKSIYADIRDTTIAADALNRGGAFVNDRYKVKMEVKPPKKEGADPQYKIIQVLDFAQAEQQFSLPLRRPRKRPSRRDER